ncbi:hypothetical protein O3P69_014831 [Scylla paramamosain]|uniref:Secreted protein n=1 Tax=Scylla paramamosain TaxID=85552 RepID=A0AAW0TZP9_SCYPA
MTAQCRVSWFIFCALCRVSCAITVSLLFISSVCCATCYTLSSTPLSTCSLAQQLTSQRRATSTLLPAGVNADVGLYQQEHPRQEQESSTTPRFPDRVPSPVGSDRDPTTCTAPSPDTADKNISLPT